MKVQPEIYFIQKDLEEYYLKEDHLKDGSQGLDLVLPHDIQVDPFTDTIEVKMGIILKAEGYFYKIYPRSSTHHKYGLKLANTAGIIDDGYCGIDDELIIVLKVEGNRAITIKKGTRLVQAVFQPTYKINPIVAFTPSKKSRGGLGSTGD